MCITIKVALIWCLFLLLPPSCVQRALREGFVVPRRYNVAEGLVSQLPGCPSGSTPHSQMMAPGMIPVQRDAFHQSSGTSSSAQLLTSWPIELLFFTHHGGYVYHAAGRRQARNRAEGHSKEGQRHGWRKMRVLQCARTSQTLRPFFTMRGLSFVVDFLYLCIKLLRVI